MSLASLSGNSEIDSLVYGTKWGGGSGSAAVVTYSFPGTGASWSTDWTNGYGPSSSGREPWDDAYAPLTASQQAATQSALQKWANVAAITFALSPDNASTVGDIRIAWTGLTGEQAHAYLPDPGAASGGDIWLNANARSWGAMAPGGYGYATLLHEIGHAFGLKHSFEPVLGNPATLPDSTDSVLNTVMSYSAYPGAASGVNWSFDTTTPMPLDIQTAQFLYGPNMTYHSGDDTYVYSAGVSYFETIWDAGGNDTIQYIATSDRAEIDLRPGAASNLGNNLVTTDGARNTPYDVFIYKTVVIENAIGGNGPDLIHGNGVANALDGRGGADTILAGAGDDTLDGGPGNDSLDGGSGTDSDMVDYTSSSGGVTVNLGTEAASGAAGIDILVGFEDLRGSGFADALTGNTFNNYIAGAAGNDRLDGGLGDDYLDGGADSDMLDYANAAGGVTVNLGSGVATGAAGTDTLVAFEDLRGSGFADALIGNTLNNYIAGATGNDRLVGGLGDDYLDGGAGSDMVDYASASAGTTVNLGAGTASGGAGLDTLLGFEDLRGSGFADALTGNSLNNYIAGGAGGDRLAGGFGDDYLDGGADSDMVDYTSAGASVVVNLGTGTTSGAAGIDTLVGFEDSRGSGFDDDLVGNALNNYLAGAAGNDYVAGGVGADYLDAGAGHDYLVGGAGADILVGSAGQDTFVLAPGSGGNALNLADMITDYQDGTDSFGLGSGLTFASLTITQGTGANVNHAVIQRAATGEYLAIVQNVSAATLDALDFKPVA